MRKRILLGAGVAIGMAFSWANAQAQWFVMPSGPGAYYFGIEGGWTSLDNQSSRIGNGVNRSFTEKYNSGYNVGARAGYEWGPLRLEEEFNFGTNKLSGASFGVLGSPGVTGQRNRYAIMTNAIYDFPLGWIVSPHLGVGIGAVNQHDAISLLPPGSPIIGGNTIASSNTWAFGYQAIVGIRYNINPALAFDLDYRYLATTDPTFKAIGGVKYTSGYASNNILASLSVRFGAPPPAPPAPPPPPVVQRQVFLVFFDWDKDTITPQGMDVVRQAADAWRAGGMVTIHVTGYTDASGSVGYNQRLSERRANNVANAMGRFGVPRQAMDVSGRGKNDQRVPTADGVREPQNRRVEIVWP